MDSEVTSPKSLAPSDTRAQRPPFQTCDLVVVLSSRACSSAGTGFSRGPWRRLFLPGRLVTGASPVLALVP